ncbi:hypothetical protein CAAN1_02S04544 [[Candida] anglica]|uniref:Uncharacterized protein n=1 Tax=[Candida] anglica TaxID=148631 RepID=A0ABP0ECW3_9ASCO
MSSPTRYNRSVLSPKTSNSKPSPTKTNSFESPLSNHRLRLVSPTKRKLFKTSPVKSNGFVIFEDPVKYNPLENTNTNDIDPYSAGLDKENVNHSNTQGLSNKQNHMDQENILQPKKNEQFRRNNTTPRKPLGNLSINEFPGYITRGGESLAGNQLTEDWIPSNANNEQNSLHKFQMKIPSFVTPPRNSKYIRLEKVVNEFAATSLSEKYLFKSNVAISEGEEDENDIDDVELHLQKRANSMRIRKRSNSVGKNNSKLKLIRKNNFQILSN